MYIILSHVVRKIKREPFEEYQSECASLQKQKQADRDMNDKAKAQATAALKKTAEDKLKLAKPAKGNGERCKKRQTNEAAPPNSGAEASIIMDPEYYDVV